MTTSSAPSAASARHATAKRHPTDYLRILYKRRWIAIPGFLVLFLSGALSSLRTVPIYEARTQLLIEKDARRATSINNVLQERQSWYNDDFYPTQYKILQSRALALRTVQALATAGQVEKVPAGPSFSFSLTGLANAAVSGVLSLVKSAPAPQAAPAGAAEAEDVALGGRVDGFLGQLTVLPIRNSLLVDLRFRSADPAYAARAVNELATQYNLQTVQSRFEGSKETNQWLQTQLEEQRKSVEVSERRLQEYKEQNRTVSVDDKQNIAVQKLTAVNGEYVKARIERLDREAEFTQLKVLKQKGQSESFPAVMSNEFVQKLKGDKAALEKERAQLASRFGENAPPMMNVQKQITDIDAKLGVEIEKVVQGVESSYRTAVAREEGLQHTLEAQKGEAIGVDRQQMEYAVLEREAAGNRELYQNLLQHSKENTVSSEFQGSNVQVIDRAEVPQYPILPQTRRDLMTAAFLGLMMALGLAFGVEYFDSRIKLPDEIKTYLGLPLLGMIPAVPGADGGGEVPMLSGDVPPNFSEAIRSLRTSLLFSSAEEGGRAVVVTSTGPGEGKTLVASSLAITLAQAGLRTLVIDADMRRPRMHEALGRPQEPGLSNVLIGEVSVAQAARPTSAENLWVLAAGHIPPNPAELLGSPKFRDLFTELKKSYDWVVIDAPPVMPVTDAAILSHASVGVLFVVGSEMTPRQTAATAVDQLREAGAKFVGGVLNRVHIQRHSYYYAPYYRKEYGTYYQRAPKRV
ncbi:MAG: polysaccharide biosynthesis tyrosine autokinase [Vicinamibacterales bacterium]